MLKRLYFSIFIVLFSIFITSCKNEKVNEYEEIDNKNTNIDQPEEEEILDNNEKEGYKPGSYVEPLTGALITFPEFLTEIFEVSSSSQRNFYDIENTTSLEVNINNYNVKTLDEMYDLFGTSTYDNRIISYEGNYLIEYTEGENLDKLHHYYLWYCLLSDGSVLTMRLDTSTNDYESIFESINIDFSEAVGEIGLVSVDDIKTESEKLTAKGIWYDKNEGIWIYCPGGILATMYDDDGNQIDCGFFDMFWDTLKMQNKVEYIISFSDDLSELKLVETTNYEPKYTFIKAESFLLKPERIKGILYEGKVAEKNPEYNPFIGTWVYEDYSCKINISRYNVTISQGYENYNGTYTVDESGVLKTENYYDSIPTEKIYATGIIAFNEEKGTLKVEGYENEFYPIDSGISPYKKFIGNWYNEDIQMEITLTDNGSASYTDPDTIAGFGGWVVLDGNKFNILNENAYLNENNEIVIEDHKGVFKKKN